jgi:uncharacterized repeat protein (TIGR01451 family)
MISPNLHTMVAISTSGLPAWWRLLLVAIATVIMSSCSNPLAAIAQQFVTDDAAANEEVTAPEMSVVIGDIEVPVPDSPAGPVGTAPSAPVFLPGTPVASEAVPVASPPCPVCGPDGTSSMVCDAYGRIIGPSDEYLCDGGDFHSPAGVRADWVVEGLEQEDAVAHYDTVDGRIVVVPSNRVCIYAPRFAAVRRVVNLMAHEQPLFINEILDEQSPAKAAETQPVASSLQRHAVAINLAKRPPILFRQRQQAGELEQLYASMEAYNSVSPYSLLEIIRTGQVDNLEKARMTTAIQSAITWTGYQAPQVVINNKRAQEIDGLRQVGIVYQADEPDNPRLRLVKLASCGHALPGEEVEFTLRFDNIGDQVIGNVTIVDNLSTRLEYIAGTAVSSVDANFITQPNPAGSSILRWEIQNPVEPGQGGVLRFRTRVR